MSRKREMAWAALAAVLWGLSSNAAAATVNVTVSSGAVVASPLGVTLAATDDTLIFKLGTAGYTFPGSGAVVIAGTGSTFKCTTATSKTTVTCKKTGTGNGSQQGYQVNVLPAGSTARLASPPDIWVISE